MNPSIENFRDLVSPWIAGYRTIWLSGVGLKDGDRNVMLTGRVVLSPSLNLDHNVDPLNDPLLWTISKVFPFKAEDFGAILATFEEGRIDVGGFKAELPDDQRDKLHPMYNPGHHYSYGGNQAAVRVPVLSATGGARSTSINKVFKANEFEWYLPTLDPPFVDAADLHAYYGLPSPSQNGDQLSLEISVNPPVEFSDNSIIEKETAFIRILAAKGTNTSLVSVGIRTVGGAAKQRRLKVRSNQITWKEADKLLEGEFAIGVADCPTVQCFLSFAGQSIQQRWILDPSRLLNPRHAMHAAYDGDHVVLRRLLFEGKKSDSREFEDGVAMVLGMLGFSVTQHGRSQKLSDAPDIMAITPQGHVAIVECTVGLPDQDDQVAKVYQRAEALRRTLSGSGWPGIRVMPVVVTSLTEGDIRLHKAPAQKQGVTILCREDIEQALLRIRLPADADQFFKQASEQLKLSFLNA